MGVKNSSKINMFKLTKLVAASASNVTFQTFTMPNADTQTTFEILTVVECNSVNT